MIVNEAKPEWWGQLEAIASRLGVKPISDDSSRRVLATSGDTRYDIGELVIALLDKLEECGA